MSQNLIAHYVSKEPKKFIALLNLFKLRLSESVFCEQRHLVLFHLCVLVDSVAENVLNQSSSAQRSQIDYFTRDFLHYLANLIDDEKTIEFKIILLNFLNRFCRKILPQCAEFVAKQLNFIVSVLVTAIKIETSLITTAKGLLMFLVIECGQKMRHAIELLDHFPQGNEFDELREFHRSVKYSRSYSLSDEIEYFLKIERRQIEGLATLKDQVRFVQHFRIFSKINFIYFSKHSSFPQENRSSVTYS